jgi:hypothetical protein
MTDMMTIRRRQGEYGAQNDDNRVLSFRDWCDLNAFSLATGHRHIKAGTGPIITQLSARRIGVTIGNNRRWQESRARSAAA